MIRMRAFFPARLIWLSGMAMSVALSAVGCFKTDPTPDAVAGNGSEVENAVVVGRVVMPNGERAGGVQVSLYPTDFNGAEDPALDPRLTTQTDSLGQFRIKSPQGQCNVWGYQASHRTRFLSQDIHVDSSGIVVMDVASLNIPGRIKISLPDGAVEGGYLYIPGTPIAVNVLGNADSTGAMILDSIPPGRIKELILGRRGKPGMMRVLAKNIIVMPGVTTVIPFTDWSYYTTIKVNATPRSTLGGPVTGIPLLLRLDSGNFDFSQARADGADIRFSKEDGSSLPCQVQSWDSLQRQALVWVRVDSVFGDTSGHRLKMYWGNTRAVAGDTAVFDSADGYVGSWHLDRQPSGSPAAFGDAGNGRDAARAMGSLGVTDSMPLIGAADGRIGGGVPLNGKDAYLMASKEYPGPSGFTVSMWFRTTTQEGGKMIGFVMPGITATYGGKPSNFNFDRVVWMDNDGLLHAGFTMRSDNYPKVIGSWQSFTAAKPYNDGQWHHLAYLLWDSGALLIVDGQKVAGYTGLVKSLPTPGHWRVGYAGEGKWDPEWTSEFFKGSVDEVRLIHRARSEDWIRMDFETQKPGSALLMVEPAP